MRLVRKWGLVAAVGCFLGAQTLEDPVMKARLLRAEAQGIEEADLPPVPRGVMEPPPLPPRRSMPRIRPTPRWPSRPSAAPASCAPSGRPRPPAPPPGSRPPSRPGP